MTEGPDEVFVDDRGVVDSDKSEAGVTANFDPREYPQGSMVAQHGLRLPGKYLDDIEAQQAEEARNFVAPGVKNVHDLRTHINHGAPEDTEVKSESVIGDNELDNILDPDPVPENNENSNNENATNEQHTNENNENNNAS